MIYTFPEFGPVAIALSKVFNELGVEYVMPETDRRKALHAGKKISPEEMCIPFKYMAGDLVLAYEKGADTAVMAATAGPCRLGEYGQLLIETVKKAECDYSWVLLDTPADTGIREFLRRADRIFDVKLHGRKPVISNIVKAAAFIRKYDMFMRKAARMAGYVFSPETVVRLRREAKNELRSADGFDSCFEILKEYSRKLSKLDTAREGDPVKIFITGEIYTSVEENLNCMLEEKLMALGCSVTRHIDVTWWAGHTLTSMLLPERIYTMFLCRKGIDCNVGGYARQSVDAVLKANKFDGVIKVMPSGCMPEIVSKSFCENLQKKRGDRILHMIYDEMDGGAGYDTRMEAFVDMLERRKNVLAGDRHRINKH